MYTYFYFSTDSPFPDFISDSPPGSSFSTIFSSCLGSRSSQQLSSVLASSSSVYVCVSERVCVSCKTLHTSRELYPPSYCTEHSKKKSAKKLTITRYFNLDTDYPPRSPGGISSPPFHLPASPFCFSFPPPSHMY